MRSWPRWNCAGGVAPLELRCWTCAAGSIVGAPLGAGTVRLCTPVVGVVFVVLEAVCPIDACWLAMRLCGGLWRCAPPVQVRGERQTKVREVADKFAAPSLLRFFLLQGWSQSFALL